MPLSVRIQIPLNLDRPGRFEKVSAFQFFFNAGKPVIFCAQQPVSVCVILLHLIIIDI